MTEQRPRSERRRLLWIGIGAAVIVLSAALPAPAGVPEPAWRCAGAGVAMALWWVTEALPLPVTALVPLVVFPALGLGRVEAVAPAYAHPLILLFFGGFVVGIAIERSGLHLRLAHALLRVSGQRPAAHLGAMMVATAGLSMWLNNTASTLAMLPVALALVPRDHADAPLFARSLLLGVAYAATIGGLATLIGTAPNALLAAYLERVHDIRIGFAQWMLVGVPTSAALLAGAWLWLGRPLLALELLARPGATAPTPDPAQRRVAAVFAVLVALWLARPLLEGALPALSDAGLALGAAFVLFVIGDGRGRPLLVWDDLRRLPWGVLVLFGGGLALGSAMDSSGLAQVIGDALAPVLGWPLGLTLAAIVLTLIVLTELASNTAVAAAFLPVVGALALGGDTDVALLAIPAGLATSCAFMMPAGTPPNAIVFADGRVRGADLARAGVVLNTMALAVLVLLVPLLARLIRPLY